MLAAPLRRLVPAVLASLIGLLGLAASAQGYVYWTNFEGDSIGRALLDGSGATQSFIGAPEAPVNPCGVAVDGEHLYWVNQAGSAPQGKIGRAKLDGSEVDNEFITGADNPCGVAVSSGYVYWGNTYSDAIGRANIDGSEPDQEFITGLNHPEGIAVDAGHIYFTGSLSEFIFRANLAGGEVEPFIATLGAPGAVAIDGAHIYWADHNERIGRANLDGSGVERNFISLTSSPDAVAVDSAHVFWASKFANTIGRANLDGSGVDESFITGAEHPSGLAVDSLPPAPTPAPPAPPPSETVPTCTARAKVVRLVRNRKRGKLKLVVHVAEAGSVRLAGNSRVRGLRRQAQQAGRVKLPLKPKRGTRKRLRKAKRIRTRVRIVYRPACGGSQVLHRRLALRAPTRRHR